MHVFVYVYKYSRRESIMQEEEKVKVVLSNLKEQRSTVWLRELVLQKTLLNLKDDVVLVS